MKGVLSLSLSLSAVDEADSLSLFPHLLLMEGFSLSLLMLGVLSLSMLLMEGVLSLSLSMLLMKGVFSLSGTQGKQWQSGLSASSVGQVCVSLSFSPVCLPLCVHHRLSVCM